MTSKHIILSIVPWCFLVIHSIADEPSSFETDQLDAAVSHMRNNLAPILKDHSTSFSLGNVKRNQHPFIEQDQSGSAHSLDTDSADQEERLGLVETEAGVLDLGVWEDWVLHDATAGVLRHKN